MKTRCYRILGLSLLVCTVLACTIPSFAVTPRWQVLTTLYATLDITSSGYARCGSDVLMDLGYTGDLTMELQQEDRGRWLTIKEWSASGRSVGLSKGYFVLEGDYRVRASVTVYDSDGIYVESASIVSGTDSYP